MADGATVPIYYESRLVQLPPDDSVKPTLDDSVKPTLDDEFDAVTEGEEVERRESLKTKWAQLEALVGADSRIDRIAANLVAHFERRLETLEGKGMVVCMSRRICVDLYEAVAVMLEKLDICRGHFHHFDWTAWVTGGPTARVSLLPQAQEHILAQPDGKDRLLRAVTDLTRAFALSVPHEETTRARDEVGFYQSVRAALAKETAERVISNDQMEHAIRQLVSAAIASDVVVDIFSAAGLPKPDISILSDEFLAEVRGMPQRNLAVELLRKLLAGEIRAHRGTNVFQARSVAQLLEEAIKRYRNRAVETGVIIEELIALAKQMREAQLRGEKLGLNNDELAFYDALETNDSAVQVLGDPTLRAIARELATNVRNNVTIDWTLRENVRAHLRVLVKRILRKYGYPPDKQERATQTVLEQAEALSALWAAA